MITLDRLPATKADWLPALRRAARELRRWGLPGALGSALLIAAAVLAAVALPQARLALQGEEEALAAVRLAAARAERNGAAFDASADPLQSFRAAFPASQERHRRITNLMLLASGLGLKPRRSDVRTVPETALGLTRVRVVLPLSGPYPALRRFIDQALREDPALSLDLLRLERSDPQAGELKAELQWSLWMQSPSADAAAAPRRAADIPRSSRTGNAR